MVSGIRDCGLRFADCGLRIADCGLRIAVERWFQKCRDDSAERLPEYSSGVDHSAWVAGVPACVTLDPLWRMKSYRLALFACEMAWEDAETIRRHITSERLASQLYRAVGSIAANIAEGYSRSSAKDRARLFEYALGSARESFVWYRMSRFVLGEGTTLYSAKALR